MGQIARQGPRGPILIRLMTALSDLTIASEGFGRWKDEEQPGLQRVREAANRYFVRMQIGHLHEALRIIDDIRQKHMADVQRC
jgi:hypothetical protein